MPQDSRSLSTYLLEALPVKVLNPLTRLTLLLAMAGSTLISTTAIAPLVRAQEYEGCFMRNRSGKLINLSQSICGFNTAEPTPTTTAAKSGVFQAKIKRREANIPVIEVTFNGKQKFEMMVDSGATGTVITPAMADALGVIKEGSIQARTPSGEATFPIGRVKSVEAGGLVVQDMVVAISSSLEIGLLGHNFFGNKDVTIKQDVVEFRNRS